MFTNIHQSEQNNTMPKMKLVIDLNKDSMDRAIGIALTYPGVEEASCRRLNRSQLKVKGKGIDAGALTALLKRELGYAQLLKRKVAHDYQKFLVPVVAMAHLVTDIVMGATGAKKPKNPAP